MLLGCGAASTLGRIHYDHVEEFTRWQLMLPVSWADSPGGDLDEKFHHWEKHAQTIKFAFRSKDLKNAVRESLRVARRLARDKAQEFSPFGFTRNQLEKLEI